MLQGSPPCVWCQSGSTLRSSGFCCVCRKHLQEIPSSSSNVSTSLEWDSSKTSELLSGMGASALKKDKLGNENTPQDLLVSSPSLPPKRQKVKDDEKDFVILRRPWLLREAESGTITQLQVLLTLQWRWRVGITSPPCFIVYFFFALIQQNVTFRSSGFQAWGDKSCFMYAFKQGWCVWLQICAHGSLLPTPTSSCVCVLGGLCCMSLCPSALD